MPLKLPSVYSRLFKAKSPKEERLLIQTDEGVPITDVERKQIEAADKKQAAAIAPIQQRLKQAAADMKEVAEYKMTPSKRREIRDALEAGDCDPMLLAAYLKCPFKQVAIIANDILREKYPGKEIKIPTDVQEYLKLANANAKAAEKASGSKS